MNLGLRSEELAQANLVYSKDPAGSAYLSAPALRASHLAVQTASRRPALASLQSLPGDPVSPRDELYAKTDLAAALLDSNLSVLGFVEQLIQKLPEPGEKQEAFSRTPLDDNFCRLKGLMADLQRPAVALQGGGYDQFKQTAGKTIDLLAEDCRRYVSEAVGNATTMQNGLSTGGNGNRPDFQPSSPGDADACSICQWRMGRSTWRPRSRLTTPWTMRTAGGMNRIFSTISYSGTNRPFYMRYMPYYVMSMRAPLFLHALSRPRQLSATTTRPGPLNLPERLAARYDVPGGVQVTHHSVSRYGLSNQTSQDCVRPADEVLLQLSGWRSDEGAFPGSQGTLLSAVGEPPVLDDPGRGCQRPAAGRGEIRDVRPAAASLHLPDSPGPPGFEPAAASADPAAQRGVGPCGGPQQRGELLVRVGRLVGLGDEPHFQRQRRAQSFQPERLGEARSARLQGQDAVDEGTHWP